MADFIFLLKMFVYSLVVVIVLQAKIGSSTIENKILNWSEKAGFSRHIEEAAKGFTKLSKDQYEKLTKKSNPASK